VGGRGLEGVIAELRGRGAIFEEYGMPGLKTVNGIVGVEGNYPSKGGAGHRSSWFKDGEGNLLAIGQAVTRALRCLVRPDGRHDAERATSLTARLSGQARMVGRCG
jgi:hypothetical protein